MGRLLAVAPICLHLLSCTPMDNAVNIPPLRRYAETLITTSGAKLALTRCDMFGPSRKGFCIVEGSAAELTAFTTQLQLAPHPERRAYRRDSCLSLPLFGQSEDPIAMAKPGVVHLAPTAPLPLNHDNVHLRSLYVAATSACLEFEYPYG